MDFEKISQQRTAKAAVVEETAAVDGAWEQLMSSVMAAKERPSLTAPTCSDRSKARSIVLSQSGTLLTGWCSRPS